MILYHFTHPNNFSSIKEKGLEPSDWRRRDGSMDQACVWFFDTPKPRDYMDNRFRRLTVSVRDDQVINHADYCRDHPGVTPVVSDAEARHIWLSLVAIPPKQITV